MKRTYLACLALAGTLLASGATRAGIIEDFTFDTEANGTVITSTVNSGPGAHTWLSENTAVNSAVFNDAFRIQKLSPTTQVGNTFDIADIASGKIWLVAELSGWSYSDIASSPSERVRFAFLDNATASAGSNTITAEMNLDRSGSSMTVTGDAGGSGSTATIPGGPVLLLNRSTRLTMVLEVDSDADTYSIYYRDAAAPFALLGTGNLGERSVGVKRDARSVRFAFTGTYDAAFGEYVDVGRIYVTNMNPIPEPSIGLLVATALIPALARRRRVG